VSDRTGLSRGYRNRSWRLARLSELLPPDQAIVGIYLAAALVAAEGGGLAVVNALLTVAGYGQALSPPETRRIER
jgi:hypothetical protein